jgi:hypothetical protein
MVRKDCSALAEGTYRLVPCLCSRRACFRERPRVYEGGDGFPVGDATPVGGYVNGLSVLIVKNRFENIAEGDSCQQITS